MKTTTQNLLGKSHDSYGTAYETTRPGSPRFDRKGNRVDGFTILRQGENPVEKKRRERAEKKRLAQSNR